MNLTTGQIPNKPCFNRSEKKLTVLGSLSCTLDIIKNPFDFCTRKIGVDKKSRMLTDVIAESLFFELLTKLCTIDGIQIDDNMHAIDQDFKAIPGLYVIGDMSGNYFSGSYPSLMAGAAAGRSATFGRFAGQNAAAGI